MNRPETAKAPAAVYCLTLKHPSSRPSVQLAETYVGHPYHLDDVPRLPEGLPGTTPLLRKFIRTKPDTVRLYKGRMEQDVKTGQSKIYQPGRYPVVGNQNLEIGGTLIGAVPDNEQLRHILELLRSREEGWEERLTIIGDTAVRKLCERIEADDQDPQTPARPSALLAHCALRAALDNTLALPRTEVANINSDIL